MHLKKITFQPEEYPTREYYPFNLKIFNETRSIVFTTPVTFFIGENGTGKSSLLKAIANKCNIHIWKSYESPGYIRNEYCDDLYKHIDVEWFKDYVPGSYFSSEIFSDFAHILDEWAKTDSAMLKYFGGESLVTKSHGQCHMAYFSGRYRIKGLYLLDEPENALSPKSQLQLLKLLKEMSKAGHAQFIIASHSPILLALTGTTIYSFDHIPVKQVKYEETDYYQIYKDFLNNKDKYLADL
ncbi:AAA family ATPase [Desulfoscipio sp. XC116]|uniref:AAA family ATPase n=1 Tax=Desulfoscipio sp. XC116 TaxID=3144975 RepID=UPI00325AC86B